jgi:hypothetical protein
LAGRRADGDRPLSPGLAKMLKIDDTGSRARPDLAWFQRCGQDLNDVPAGPGRTAAADRRRGSSFASVTQYREPISL